jgi:hypothetical protein
MTLNIEFENESYGVCCIERLLVILAEDLPAEVAPALFVVALRGFGAHC